MAEKDALESMAEKDALELSKYASELSCLRVLVVRLSEWAQSECRELSTLCDSHPDESHRVSRNLKKWWTQERRTMPSVLLKKF
eukprot:6209601-Pleurochrysis_carterae.AAC.4